MADPSTDSCSQQEDGSQAQSSSSPEPQDPAPSSPTLPPPPEIRPISPLQLRSIDIEPINLDSSASSASPDPLGLLQRGQPPQIRIIRPSIPPSFSTSPRQMAPFGAVASEMLGAAVSDASEARVGQAVWSEKGKERDVGERPPEGKQQTLRRGLIEPGGIIGKCSALEGRTDVRIGRIRSRKSLRKLAITPSYPSAVSTGNSTSVPTKPISYLRPLPARPDTPSHYGRRFDLPSSPSTSGSPSRQPSPLLSALPTAQLRSVTSGPAGEKMVEIPRFKRRELNLRIVERRGPGLSIAWLGLWVFWLSNGLLSLVCQFKRRTS